jgi:heat shock protein HtpX
VNGAEPGIDPLVWEEHAWRNRLQSLFLLAVMGSFMGLLGWLLWGETGVWMMLFTTALGVAFNPGISPRWVMRLYGAQPLRREQAPELFDIVETLAQRAGLARPPALYWVPSSMLNAFAVGTPEQSAVAVTDGLLRNLDLRELNGVLAHEISHVRNRDLWVMGLADLFSRATSTLSLFGQFLLLANLPLILLGSAAISWSAILLLVFAPTLSGLAQLALSRTREYDADLNAARLTGDPDGLASALAKIERVQGNWLERIFLPGRRVPEPSLLRTHPETADRIARLMELKRRMGTTVSLAGLPGGALHLHGLGGPVQRHPGWHLSGLWH